MVIPVVVGSTYSTVAAPVLEQLTPLTHFIVTELGQLTHLQVVPAASGHQIVIV
jgi:hypothetical protein